MCAGVECEQQKRVNSITSYLRAARAYSGTFAVSILEACVVVSTVGIRGVEGQAASPHWLADAYVAVHDGASATLVTPRTQYSFMGFSRVYRVIIIHGSALYRLASWYVYLACMAWALSCTETTYVYWFPKQGHRGAACRLAACCLVLVYVDDVGPWVGCYE